MRIVHISDLHIEPAPERRFPGLMASLERDRTAISRHAADLVVVTGDVTNYGGRYRDHLVLARDWIEGLDAPTLVVPGNHDLGPSPARAADNPENEAYQDAPYPETNFGTIFHPSPVITRDAGPVRVIGIGLREGDPDGVLPRLERLLRADTRPVILCGHYPVVDTREVPVSSEFGSAAYLPTTAPALLELIRAHRNVAVYAGGHVHVNSVRRIAPHCVQMTAGGLGPGASSYRVYDLDARGLTYSTVLGSGSLTFWEAEMDVAPAEGFSLGTPEERTGRISWPTSS
ncbi:metallophosphoesterase family protein [Phytoactinopolyspora limicola]|uniref:metallophosphoesterase family protein n=1 Tax=Phytoactinopolyspora limicola TaxID=2715536 RepID=UPI00140DBBB2|nr:metallophosphoesterase [Phytoactinopolyspora limicola]